MLQYQSMHAGSRQAGNGQATPAKLPVFDFGFYHELANAEVAVKVPAEPGPGPTSATVSKVASPVVATTTAAASAAQPDVQAVNYLLQAGSFQDKQEADERRAKITLLNMSADIVPGVVGGRTWYRVQVGPFAGRNAAEDARKQLSASNIDSLPLLMR